MIEGLVFQPWVGEHYGNGKYGRLLIIGESHYTKQNPEYEKSNNLTSEVVQEFIDKDVDYAFYRNLGLLFNKEDKYELWKNVAFANAIQRGLSDAASQPEKEDINTVISAFWRLIEELKPDKILICSKRMWNNWMPDSDERGQFLSSISENNKNSTIWSYQHGNGNCIAMGINHPSKYFSPSEWGPLVNKFLSQD